MCLMYLCVGVTGLIHTGDMTRSLTHMCDMTHSYVWYDSLVCVTWLICMCDMTHSLIHIGDITHSYRWHDSFACVPWLSHTRDMTHSFVWHYWFICVPWLIRMCAMTHAYVCHDSCIYVPWLIHTRSCVWHDSFVRVHMCVTHSYAWHDWLSPIVADMSIRLLSFCTSRRGFS